MPAISRAFRSLLMATREDAGTWIAVCSFRFAKTARSVDTLFLEPSLIKQQ